MTVALATQPETLVDRLRDRLTIHALWEAVLIFLPLLLAGGYIVFILYRFAWVGADAVLITNAALLVAAGAAAAALSRRRAPSRRLAARLIDEKADGQDRFMTLATIDPAVCSPALLSRLRAEAASFQSRLEVRKDFPFRVRRSFLNSCIGALVAIMVFHVLFELLPAMRPASPAEEMALMSHKLAGKPRFFELSRRLATAASKLENGKLSEQERQSIYQEMLEQLGRQIALEKANGGTDGALLEQTREELKKLQKREDTWSITLPFKLPSLFPIPLPWIKQPGEEAEDDTGDKGAGGSQARSAQERGAGQNKIPGRTELQKENGATKQPIPAPNAKDQTLPDPSSTGRLDVKESGEKKGKKTGSEDQGTAAGREPKGGLPSKTGEPRGDRIGTGSKFGEKIPERFLGPGEKGQAAAKDARFVIVELPEEETGPATGRTSDGKRKVSGTILPSANLPLGRPDGPDAAAEKQMLPLEYRGMIR
jgi:hypothetical protein